MSVRYLFIVLMSLSVSFASAQQTSRCYVCDFDVQNNNQFSQFQKVREICTSANFDANNVQQLDCPGGCESLLVTDATGNVVKWRRGCAQQAAFPIGSQSANVCVTEYSFGRRIDKCTCNDYLCNGSESQLGASHIAIFAICSLIVYASSFFP